MTSIIFLATAWGPQHGGINSFSADLSAAVATALGSTGQVFCTAFRPSPDDVADALSRGVKLLSVDQDEQSDRFETHQVARLMSDNPVLGENADLHWLGHDVITGGAALEGARLTTGGKAALIMHMDYSQYQSINTLGASANEKVREQRKLFSSNATLFAVGPLLRDALRGYAASDVTMLVPGLHDIEQHNGQGRLTVVTFGRMDRANDRLKQGFLAVAGFAAAVRYAHEHPIAPPALLNNPGMRIYGITHPGDADERSVRQLAQSTAGRLVEVAPLPFELDRATLFDELRRFTVAMMLSWHDGFGLTGWEAISAGVPLILSKQSGLWRFIVEAFGELFAGVYVVPIDIRGHSGEDGTPNYLPADETDVRDAIIRLAASPAQYRVNARRLRDELLKSGYICTWENTAKVLLEALGVTAEPALSMPQAASEPRPLSFSELPAQSGRILDAWQQAIPFHQFRRPIVTQLTNWALDLSQNIMLRADVGRTGSGKTRLALEVVRELTLRFGWNGAFVEPNDAVTVHRLLREQRPTILVFEDAESRVSEMVLAVKAALRVPDKILRIVATATQSGDWWNNIGNANLNDSLLETIFSSTKTKSGPFRLFDEFIPFSVREDVCFDTYAALAGFPLDRSVAPAWALNALRALDFDSFLLPALAARCVAAGKRFVTSEDVLLTAARIERVYLSSIARVPNSDIDYTIYLEEVLACVTLSGAARNIRDTRVVASNSPRFASLERDIQSTLLLAIKSAYSRDDRVRGVIPRTVGNTILLEVVRRNPILIDSFFRRGASSLGAQNAMRTLTRAVQQSPGDEALLARVVESHFDARSADILNVALKLGPPLDAIYETILRRVDPGQSKQAIQRLQDVVPSDAKAARELRVQIALQNVRVTERRAQLRSRNPDLVASAISLAEALVAAGRHSEAKHVALTTVHTLDRQATSTSHALDVANQLTRLS
jgi:glycosyltransferase involved in cell wall biosynthesis